MGYKIKISNRFFKLFALPCLLLAGFLFFSTSLQAAPRTLYKPVDIENARENLKRYAWAKDIVHGWKNSTKFALQQDRQFFVDLIPELTPGSFYGQNCPACVGKKSLMGETSLFLWSVTEPNSVKCKRCGTVFPSEAYPETGVLECPLMGQVFRYYQSTEERALGQDATAEQRARHALKWAGDRPTMTSFSGMVRFGRVSWAWGQVLILAKLYAVTGDTSYAERVAWILDRFAQVFPRYLYHSYYGSYADFPPGEVAANMGDRTTPAGGRFPLNVIRNAYGMDRSSDAMGEYSTLLSGFWGSGRLNPHGKGSDAGPLLNMAIAYDLTRDARYADGRPVYEAAMHRRICDDLLIAGCRDMEHWDDVSNKGVASFSLSAAVGLLLDDPVRVRRALEGFQKMLTARFHFDGFYAESPAYAVHNYSNMHELPDMLYGYSDPLDYKPRKGSRLDAFNPYAGGKFHLFLLSMMRQLAPGNHLPVIADTSHETVISPVYAEVLAARLGGPYASLAESLYGAPLSEWGNEYSLWYRSPDLSSHEQMQKLQKTEWFPGWHVGFLRGHRENSDAAFYLNGNEHAWTVRTTHRHRDILGISYYAFGQELASDRGYYASSMRLTDGRSGGAWLDNSLSHNLVVVDEKSQANKGTGSNLELFGAIPGIEVVQASAFAAYPQTEDYRRTCAMIETPDGQSYVVDFFRVKGGKIHQYAFNSNGTLVSINPSQPLPKPTKLSAEWGLWLKKPRDVVPFKPHTFTWQFRKINFDLMLLNAADSVDRIIIADAPGWRKGIPKSDLEKPAIQQILAEKRADEPLTTQYAAVMVPYMTEKSPVVSARLLENDSGSGAMVVEVRFENRTDYIISTRDQQLRSYGPVTVAGQFAVASVDNQGRVLQAYLLAGTELACGKTKITLAAPQTTLRVASVSDRNFHLTEPLLPDMAPTGTYLLANGPAPLRKGLPRPRTGFEIEAATVNSITVRDYPVCDCDEVTILHSKHVKLEK